MTDDNYIFFGMKEIMKFYKIGSEDKFYSLVKIGMPAKKIVVTWIGTQKNIDEFFHKITQTESSVK